MFTEIMSLCIASYFVNGCNIDKNKNALFKLDQSGFNNDNQCVIINTTDIVSIEAAPQECSGSFLGYKTGCYNPKTLYCNKDKKEYKYGNWPCGGVFGPSCQTNFPNSQQNQKLPYSSSDGSEWYVNNTYSIKCAAGGSENLTSNSYLVSRKPRDGKVEFKCKMRGK